MRTEKFLYSHGDTKCIGFLAFDEKRSGSLPGILVAPAFRGQDEFAREKALTLAKLGYIGLAVDIYGEGKHTENNEEAKQLMAPFFFDRKWLQGRMIAALDALKKHPKVDPTKISAIGFCFGGLAAYELLRSGADVKRVVTFHGIFAFQRDGREAKLVPISSNIKGSLLILQGYEDPFVTKKELEIAEEELTFAKVDWQVHMYGHTMHSFTNPAAQSPQEGKAFNTQSAARAWQAMVDFFKEVF